MGRVLVLMVLGVHHHLHNRQARQIIGLASEVNSETYSHTNIVTSKSPWLLCGLNSSTGCSDNDNFPHHWVLSYQQC